MLLFKIKVMICVAKIFLQMHTKSVTWWYAGEDNPDTDTKIKAPQILVLWKKDDHTISIDLIFSRIISMFTGCKSKLLDWETTCPTQPP